ncbi:RNA polymerase sigma factor [Chitinibacter sp. ZOR0017]|uniref:RNA polymerase sigma factor n=1 Tax=Chitinibacter sp. ZOR0017 TaxID=1339254 RepID=UPI000648CDF0|nr:RNA polymerase sigma factor [Chitinibacter sp. ZOR0017]
MSSAVTLDAFLREVEQRAWRQAWIALRDEQAALDVVQEAMFKLASHYGDKPATEWPLLFQRILQNTIRDAQRRTRVRNLWQTLFSALGGDPQDTDESDPLEYLPGAVDERADAASWLNSKQHIALIEAGLARLPARQREAFLLRYWEELDVAETAAVMGCSTGSVKTHCSRACHTLAAWLREQGVTL